MIGRDALGDRAWISGVGRTRYSFDSGRSVLALATEAVTNAIDDAGLHRDDIDGLLCFHMNDSAPVRDVATALQVANLSWWTDVLGGGSVAPSVVGQAALLVAHGAARNVVVYRAMNGRSGVRMGRHRANAAGGTDQFLAPYGFGTAPQMFGMVARRHMHRYGTTHEQLGAVAIAMRRNAADNPHALRRRTITMDDYLGSRMIADPFRALDCCLESDGAVALVVSASPDPAGRDRPPVRIESVASGGGPSPRLVLDRWPDFTHSAFRRIGDEVFRGAGRDRTEVDVALLYDAFTFEVLQQLEELGFCELGQAGPFVEAGGIDPGGQLPVNPHGGLLSEAYIHGFNHFYEAVAQLRGEAGVRQIPDARLALVTGYGFSSGGAVLLSGVAR